MIRPMNNEYMLSTMNNEYTLNETNPCNYSSLNLTTFSLMVSLLSACELSSPSLKQPLCKRRASLTSHLRRSCGAPSGGPSNPKFPHRGALVHVHVWCRVPINFRSSSSATAEPHGPALRLLGFGGCELRMQHAMASYTVAAGRRLLQNSDSCLEPASTTAHARQQSR
jgi:hypothetical protein